jgi:hypothetical protein
VAAPGLSTTTGGPIDGAATACSTWWRFGGGGDDHVEVAGALAEPRGVLGRGRVRMLGQRLRTALHAGVTIAASSRSGLVAIGGAWKRRPATGWPSRPMQGRAVVAVLTGPPRGSAAAAGAPVP